MRLLPVTLAGLLISLGALFATVSQAADKDLPNLQGKWSIVSVNRDGKPVEAMAGGTRELTADKYTITPKTGDKVTGNFSINSGATPKSIDMTSDSGQFKGKTLKGIYKLEGDTLTICFNPPDKDRPTTFASQVGSGAVLAVHKKAK